MLVTTYQNVIQIRTNVDIESFDKHELKIVHFEENNPVSTDTWEMLCLFRS